MNEQTWQVGIWPLRVGGLDEEGTERGGGVCGVAGRASRAAHLRRCVLLWLVALALTSSLAAKTALLNEIFARPVSLVLGETGSGKTTQLPQYLTEDPRGAGCVCVTQPRRVAAVTVATRIARERGEEVGKQSVGYSVRFDERCAKDARIRVVTDGMLLREAMIDPALSRYSVIVLDEAHERSLATDLLLSLLKALQRTRARPLRLVVMSATLDPRLFLGFFGLDLSAVLYIEGARHSCLHSFRARLTLSFFFFFAGRQYPVNLFFTRDPVEDVVDGALQTVLKIAQEAREGDVLVFLDGQEDIEALRQLLRTQISLKKLSLTVLPLYSALPQRQQMRVFAAPKQAGCIFCFSFVSFFTCFCVRMRRVVLATNIAETSVTIPGIVFVVDGGLHKLRTFDPLRSLSRLQSVPISRNSARQRTGRAGRERPGVCYRLFTEQAFFGEMEEAERSEIARSNMAHVVLTLLALRVPNVLQFDFVERPSLAALGGALEELAVLGAVDLAMRLTPLGTTLAVFPLDPSLAKVLPFVSFFFFSFPSLGGNCRTRAQGGARRVRGGGDARRRQHPPVALGQAP